MRAEQPRKVSQYFSKNMFKKAAKQCPQQIGMCRFYRKYAVRLWCFDIFTILRKWFIFNEMHEHAILCLCLRLQFLWFGKLAFSVIFDFCVYMLRFLCLSLLVCLWFEIFLLFVLIGVCSLCLWLCLFFNSKRGVCDFVFVNH